MCSLCLVIFINDFKCFKDRNYICDVFLMVYVFLSEFCKIKFLFEVSGVLNGSIISFC